MPWSKCAKRFMCYPGVIFLMLCLSVVVFSQNAPPALQSSPAPPPPENQRTEPPPTPPPPLIMIDPAHGGSESGAVLGPDNLEKDVTLALARRLRQDLISRGLQVLLVREGDTLLSTDQRASSANAARPAFYVCVHATSQGSGMRIYTAMLPSADTSRGPFASWQTAQAASLPHSRSLQQQITTAIQKTRFPVRSLVAPLRPLNNLTMPAVAVEIAPATGQASQLATADYQQMVSAVLANAIAGARGKLEASQ